jgi:hypothetical protein
MPAHVWCSVSGGADGAVAFLNSAYALYEMAAITANTYAHDYGQQFRTTAAQLREKPSSVNTKLNNCIECSFSAQ